MILIFPGGIQCLVNSCRLTLVIKIYNHQKYAINYFAKKSIIYLGNVLFIIQD